MLTRGLKNWVVEDGRSIEAAMADARRDEERTLASAQLEAFHQTFNFCMDCRQYTCLDCWNQAEGRCLSCAPTPGQLEAEAAAMPATAFGTAAVPITAGPDEGMVWPTSDLTSDEPAETVVAAAEVATVLPYVPTDLRPVELPDDEIETIIGAADAAAVEPQAAVEPEAGPIAAVQAEAPEAEAPEVEPEAVAAIGSGGIAQPEVEDVAEVAMPMAAAAAGAALVTEPDIEIVPEEPEPIAAKEPEPIAAKEPEPIAAKEPEPVEAEEPEPVAVEPVAAAAALAPEELPEPPRPQPSPAPAAWTIMAPDAGETPSAPPAWPPRAPVYQPPAQAPDVRPAQPGQPAQPAWPSMPPAAFTVPAAQAVWEESSLSVISRPGSGVQACVSCGLPLSATARFCRRCGSRQG